MKQYLSLVAILGLSTLNAGEFHALGGNSISMGGAGVASASGSLAGYYNPALLTQKKGVEVSIGVGLGIRENNIGEQVDTLSEMELTDIVDRIANNAPISGTNTDSDKGNIIKAQETLESISDENGIVLMPTAHLGVQYDNMAIGLYLSSDIAISAQVDKNHLALSVQGDNGNYYLYNAQNDTYETIDQDRYEESSLEYALDNQLTTVKVTGLALTEVPVSYAHAFDLAMGELSLGGSLKLMHGTTYNQTLDIDDDTTDEDSLKENQEDSDNIGLDLGLLFKPISVPNLSIGLVAKNINSPAFDTSDGGEIKADLQVRTGVQYILTDTVELAGDLDLTSNKTLMNGYDSQMFGGGINFHPVSWFALRGGLMQNLANSNEGLVYTAGIALGLQQFQLDISAQMASNTGEYDGESIPKYAKVNVALVSKW